jgi:hypothetical protein
MGVPLIASLMGNPSLVYSWWFLGAEHGIYTECHETCTAKKCQPICCSGKRSVKRKRGVTNYDLWGAPDRFDESEPMWGVYRFKEGLGGEVVRFIGAWDYPVNPVYTKPTPSGCQK